jgi:hypothetical protein
MRLGVRTFSELTIVYEVTTLVEQKIKEATIVWGATI